MFTTEEARIARPATTRQIPHGATLECSRQDVLRALEEKDRSAERARVLSLNHQIDRAVRTVISTVANFSGGSQPSTAAGNHSSK